MQGIMSGQVAAGDVVVIRYDGPRGGPGMQEMLSPTSALMGMGWAIKLALITDGRFSAAPAAPASGMFRQRLPPAGRSPRCARAT